jgi:acetoin utilization deacetylase AcuC-like enzyme
MERRRRPEGDCAPRRVPGIVRGVMRVSFHPDYRADLPASHPYPMGKYPLLHERLLTAGLITAADVDTPEEAPLAMLARVHTRDYLDRLAGDALSAAEQRRLGLPWSARLWRRARLAVHGTWLAAEAALREGLAANLAGGTHHAFAGHGEGFCVLNDVAIAIRRLQAEQRAARALVVDLDVHQGNGTASIFADAPDVYTLSLHGERNYPARKARSTLDVGLPDGAGDAAYLAALDGALGTALAAGPFDIAFFVAGVDVVAGDRYGRLAVSVEGLHRRERLVLTALRTLPTVIVLGGGYAATSLHTAQLHAIVFEEAAALGRTTEQRQ